MKKNKIAFLVAVISLTTIVMTGCRIRASADEVYYMSEPDLAFYDSERMVGLLVSEECEITEEGNQIYVDSPSGEAAVLVEVFPGIQNIAGFTNTFREGLIAQESDSQVSEVEESDDLAQAAYAFNMSYDDEDSSYNYDYYVMGANQSAYLITFIYDPDSENEEIDYMEETLYSIEPLVPETVNYDNLSASYKEMFKKYAASDLSHSDSATDITALPYEGYGEFWRDDLYDSYDFDLYQEENLQADSFTYPDLGKFWSYSWDKDRKWKFYEEHPGFYQKGALNEEANKAEADAQESIDAMWNYEGDTVWGGVTRDHYNNALNKVNALKSQYAKTQMMTILNKVNDKLTAQENEAAAAAAAQAAAEAAAAQAAADAAAAAQAQAEYDFYSWYGDPGDGGLSDYYDDYYYYDEYDLDNWDRYDAYYW